MSAPCAEMYAAVHPVTELFRHWEQIGPNSDCLICKCKE